jgi:glycosyltransferase involved in cell wall biosynthesis
MKSTIDILLSTYNGEMFLIQQIDSLLSQSFQSWNLLIRDDGSSDKTTQIIDSCVSQHPNQVFLLKDNLGNIGPLRSFETLLRQSTAPYVMFCDQDDVWLPNKIELSYSTISTREQRNMPALAYSDMTVVDEHLNVIASSFFRFENIATRYDNHYYYLISKNVAAGCTLIINRPLIKLSLPFGKDAIMHDGWLTHCCVLAGGSINAIAETTVLYRQHAHNRIGAEPILTKSVANCFLPIIKIIFSSRKRNIWIGNQRRFVLQAREACKRMNTNFSIARYFREYFAGKIGYVILAKLFKSFRLRTWNYCG